MKVLVTGGLGFLGYHICSHFKDLGADVWCYDNMAKHEFMRNPYMRPESREHNRIKLEEKGVKVLIEDIRNKEVLLKAAQGAGYICHTAAQPAMTISWENPELDFSTNTLGTFNVLEAARINKIPVAICSSIHTFGPDGINATLQEEGTRYTRKSGYSFAIDESEPLLQGVVTPLHASKRSNEIYLQSYIDTYQLQAACFRLTGIYGPNQFGGEDHGWVANFCIRAVLGLPVTIFGSGKQLRDILFASDAAKAFSSFYQNPQAGIYNLGAGEKNTISLLECLGTIEEIVGKKIDVKMEPGRFGDLKYFVADSSRFQKATHWEANVKPKEGISKLIEWVQRNRGLFYQEG